MTETASAEKPAVLVGEVISKGTKRNDMSLSDQVQDPKTGKFLKGNPWAWKPGQPPGPGRTPGLRNKVNADFLQALSDDFNRHGVKAIQRMRNAKPHVYVQVIASLLPKQVQIEEKPLDGLGDADLAAILSVAREALVVYRDAGEGEGPPDGDQPTPRIPALPETT